MQPLTPTSRDGCSPTRDRDGRAQSPPVDVRVDVHHGPPRPLVRVSGELDLAAVPLLEAMLDHARGKHARADGRPEQRSSPDIPVDVDLSQVTFADSYGLSPILNGNTTVVSASAIARRVLVLLQEVEPLRRADRRPRPAASPSPRWTGADRRRTWRRQPA